VSLEDEIDPAARSEREVTDAIGRLDAGDKTALVRIARIYGWRSQCKVEDMIREAFDRVLHSQTPWPRNVPAVLFFAAVMRAIAGQRQSGASPTVGDTINARRIASLFDDDRAARRTVIAMMDGARGEDLLAASGLGRGDFERTRTRIRRGIAKFVDATR
jgi:hypothetical protein